MLSLRKPLWLLLACLGLFVCTGWFGERFVRTALPLYQQSIQLLAPEAWDIAPLQITRQGREAFISMHLTVKAPFYLNGHLLPPDLPLQSATLLGHALQPLLIMVFVVLAWAIFSTGRRKWPLILLLPLFLTVEAIDVPLVLVGSVWDLLQAHFTPDAAPLWQVRAMNLLNSGGRQALSIAASFTAIALGSRLHDQSRLQDQPLDSPLGNE